MNAKRYCIRLLLLIVVSSPGFTIAAEPDRVLPDLAWVSPASNPPLPDEMGLFIPPTSATEHAAAIPRIAAANTTAGPDNTIAVTGDFVHTQFLIYGQTTAANAKLGYAQLAALTPDGALLTVPDSQPANSMYLLWPDGGEGAGPPVAINQTHATWLMPAAAAAGQAVSLYGKNLTNGAAKPSAWIYIQPKSGAGQWAQVTAVNPYKIDFLLPANLANGDYQIWAHNGLGGKYGWSQPLNLTVQAAFVWSAQTKDVKDFGAIGDGQTDDGPAIGRAIKATPHDATLHFPAGTYLIGNEQITLANHVRLSGDGPQKTILRFTADVKALYKQTGAGDFAIGIGDNTAQHIQLDSLKLDYAGPSTSGALVRLRYGSDLTFNNVALGAASLCPVDWQGSTRLTMQNCTVVGQGLALLQTHDVRIDRTAFREAYEPDAAINVWQGHNIAITHCTFQDDNPTTGDSSGWGCGRILENGCIWGTIYNEYFAENVSIALGGRRPDNDGEQLCNEGVVELFKGAPLSATATTVNLPPTVKPLAGFSLIILNGIGVGQLRTVTSFTSDAHAVTLTLDRPWAVIPDTASIVEFCTTVRDSVFYDNAFQCRPGRNGAVNLQAASGLELWDGGYDIVFDNNTTDALNHGVLLSSDTIENPCYFVDILNNRFKNSQQHGVDYWPTPGAKNPNFIGVILRNNTVDAARQAGINLYHPARPAAATLSAIEHNTILNAPIGLTVYADRDVLVYRNAFDAGTAARPGTVAVLYGNAFAAIALRDNTYRRFSRDFATARATGR